MKEDKDSRNIILDKSWLNILKSEMEVLKIEKRVHGRVRKQMERSQKEFYLNEQIKAIQKELGKRDEFKTDIDELKQKIKKAKMPKEINEKATKELKRMGLMQPMSAEATVARTYIEWLADLPWKKDAGAEKIKISETCKKWGGGVRHWLLLVGSATTMQPRGGANTWARVVV